MPVSHKDNFPQKIKDYPIVKRIGKGGMGEVYLAKHPTLHRDVILKSLSIRGDKESNERFLQEAAVMMEFHHENIVQVYDHFKEGRSTYIAMEYVNGKDLNALLTERAHNPAGASIPIPLALFVLYQVALGLHHAHSKNVIHRDIKPHNILLSVNGDVKIVDFGIARRVGAGKDEPEQNLTQMGTIIGTPAYMSPEQFVPGKELTLQTDIYSLGVVFYQMITGVKPFKNEYTPEVVSAIASGRFVPAHKLVKNLPLFVRKILAKMLNPKPKKRYKNLIPLIKILRKYFKQYNILELKDSIKRLVLGDKNLEKSYFFKRFNANKRKRIIMKKIRITSIVIIVLLAGFFGTNMQYELLLRNQYGRVNFEFELANMDPTNLFISIDDKTRKVTPEKRHFSKTFYLKKGEHNFAVISGSFVNNKRLDVKSITQQCKNGSYGLLSTFIYPSQICKIPIAPLKPEDVSVYFRFWDSLSDKLLYVFNSTPRMNMEILKNDDGALKIKIGNKYQELQKYIYDTRVNQKNIPLYSGHTYQLRLENFKVGKNRYLTKNFDLPLNLELRSIVSHNYLDIAPATVKITSNAKCYDIYINGKKTFYNYENNQYKICDTRFLKYEMIDKNKKQYSTQMILPPGEYEIKIGQKGHKKKIKLYSDNVENIKIEKKDGKYIY